jgi:hypothetical protein
MPAKPQAQRSTKSDFDPDFDIQKQKNVFSYILIYTYYSFGRLFTQSLQPLLGKSYKIGAGFALYRSGTYQL